MTGIATDDANLNNVNEIPHFESYLKGNPVTVKNKSSSYTLQKPIINEEIQETWNNYKIYTVGYGNMIDENSLFEYGYDPIKNPNGIYRKRSYGGEIIHTGDSIELSIEDNKLQFTGTVKNPRSNFTLSPDKIYLKKMSDIYTFIEYSLMNMTITKEEKNEKGEILKSWSVLLTDISGIKTTAKEENKIITRENSADNQSWGYINLDSLITAIKSQDSNKEITDEDLNGANITIHWQRPATKTVYEYSMYYILMKHILPQNGGYYQAVKTDGETASLSGAEKIFYEIYTDNSSSQEITMSALQNGTSIRVKEGKNIKIEVIFANNDTFTTEVENIQEGDDLIKKANGELYIDLDALAKKAGKSDSLSFIGATINITYI